MPRPYPKEFRDDVVRVARNREPGVTIEQVATDFGVHPMTLTKWLRQADIDDGVKAGTTTSESTDLRAARQRIRLLEQENEVLRRAAAYLSQANLPGKGSTQGKLYCCAIKDVFSNRIVGYSIAERMKSQLAVTTLHNAVARRGDVAGCVLHTDRGSQFRSRKFVAALHYYGMVGSMGRVGAAGDNAAMESFFSLLQKNVLNRRHWVTRDQLRIAIVTWIERTYHRRRRQIALGRLTPIEFEAIMTTPASQAA